MTVDRSLKLRSTLVRARSVLTRGERLAELKEAGRKKIPVIQRGEMLSEILRKGFSVGL